MNEKDYVECFYSEKGICNLAIANKCKYNEFGVNSCKIPFQLFYISKVVNKELTIFKKEIIDKLSE